MCYIFVEKKKGGTVYSANDIRKCVFPHREEPIGLVAALDTAVVQLTYKLTIVKNARGHSEINKK